GLQESKGLKFHDAIPVFAVRNFDIADIEHFLEKWYQNIEIAVLGNADENEKQQAIRKGKSGYEDLMLIIQDEKYENLRRLAVNPLLLTIIAIVHRTRAALPKERHKLYEECLKVMIESWIVANKKLEKKFSVENSLANLACIAAFLMKENRREAAPQEIDNLLPAKIEDHSRQIFIKEMVLKAGLLYESEGKLGFMHLTFQEYLAAYYYARSKDQNDILKYWGRDYWNESFKLFVNLANAHTFYNEIIDNLEEKEYWRNMQLWDECLEDIVLQQTREEIETRFAHKILDLLPGVEYKEENEPLIIQLSGHYPLYNHAEKFIDQGWDLFYRAKHLFVQSVGSSILNRAGDKAQAELIVAIKKRIDEFEKIENKTKEQLLDFLFQNNNSFVLLTVGRQNVCDFYFALAKLKSRDFFINYLDLRYIRDLFDIRYLSDILGISYIIDYKVLMDLLGYMEIEDTIGLRDHINLRNNRCIYFQFSRYIENLKNFRGLFKRYLEKYETIIKKHQKELDVGADKVIAKLHELSDQEILVYFPGTSPDDLKYFREHKP
ncbi:MAG: hypothetical protein L0Y73_09280, partial [Candidatus Aminicenantes bacterium]|nr:hypothetical protein [Candidatus Aminicenantes bacterium]